MDLIIYMDLEVRESASSNLSVLYKLKIPQQMTRKLL